MVLSKREMQMVGEKILLVEDATSMQLMVRAAIGNEYEITFVNSIAEANKYLTNNIPAIVILDVQLPDGSGFDFCKNLRAKDGFKNIPIIFLTGETEIDQRVHGFEIGADDYVTKPFEPHEFKARVISKLKRKKSEGSETSFTKSVFRIDWPSQKAFVEKDGKSQAFNLTPIEFRLFVQFLRNEGKIFSREDLLNSVWGDAIHVSGHTVDTHISSLRKKMGEYGSCFKAVVRKGYCFTLQDVVAKITSA